MGLETHAQELPAGGDAGCSAVVTLFQALKASEWFLALFYLAVVIEIGP